MLIEEALKAIKDQYQADRDALVNVLTLKTFVRMVLFSII